MKKYIINTFLKIFGISAASGLVYSNDIIQLISDDSNYLYEYQISKNQKNELLLKEHIKKEHIKKSEKLDFEAIATKDDTIFIFGSGSKPNREYGFKISEDKKIDTLFLNNLYSSMKSFAEIGDKDFNIEGAYHNGEDWYFLNRGNGPNNKNIIFTTQGKNLSDNFNLFFNEIELPAINGNPTGFSDGVIIKNQLFFLATAEGGASTYDDGAIGGTLLGVINLKKMRLEFAELISPNQKFEGITVYHQKDAKNISFLLCEDNDNGNKESIIYKIDINLKKRIK